MFSATEAFMMALQATAEVKDNRDEGERLGYISQEASDEEAIGQVLTNMLLMNTREMAESEALLNGQMMTAFLFDYYDEEVLTIFMTLYAHAKKINSNELVSDTFSTHFDFDDTIIQGNELGWKNHWNAFKEPYCYQWEDGIIH